MTSTISSSLSIVACLIEFDHITGPRIQCQYPEQIPDTDLGSFLPAYALPDAIHRNNLDFVYFLTYPDGSTEEHLSGVSCFRQYLTDAADRSCIQRAIAIGLFQKISDPFHLSIYTILQSALSRPARLFFERHSIDQDPLPILQALHNDAEVALTASLSSSRHSNIALMSSFKKLMASAPEQTLTVIKGLNAGATVVIYSQASLHHLTSTVLAFAVLTFGPVSVLPYVPIQYLEQCQHRSKHTIMGTNNHLLWTKASAHVFFNVDTLEIRMEQGVWADVLRLTRADKRFASQLALSENSDSVASLYKDYQSRAIRGLNSRLKAENGDGGVDIAEDRLLQDFNTSWAGIMFGFTRGQLDGSADEIGHTHPCHDDDDGDDVFDEGSSLGSIWNSISAQTAAIGDQAHRTLFEASSSVSSWIGSLAQSISSNDQDPDASMWTD